MSYNHTSGRSLLQHVLVGCTYIPKKICWLKYVAIDIVQKFLYLLKKLHTVEAKRWEYYIFINWVYYWKTRFHYNLRLYIVNYMYNIMKHLCIDTSNLIHLKINFRMEIMTQKRLYYPNNKTLQRMCIIVLTNILLLLMLFFIYPKLFSCLFFNQAFLLFYAE